MSTLSIKGARENNLKNISLDIPLHQFVVVTGVSGSGKSSLVFDVIANEGRRRFYETMPNFARQYAGKLNPSLVDHISGLPPVIVVGQKKSNYSDRSTVGTISNIQDQLSLLFARFAESNTPLKKSHFSFNSEVGQCPSCKGLGEKEIISVNKLITDENLSIREGVLAPTLPNGYVMYSQVTLEVLNQVCEAEGFNIDIPWKDLSEQHKDVILNGSEQIKVPFGKHSLESRLKWTGIKAKPREEGYYKGMLPIMSDILKRDRNANILKYVEAIVCPSCNGDRLGEIGRNATINGKSFCKLLDLEIQALNTWLNDQAWDDLSGKIVASLSAHLSDLEGLGIGYLTINRKANTLSESEVQRMKVVNQLSAGLSDVLYVFDEPSIGLNADENLKMIAVLKSLVEQGNSVIVVDHQLATIKNADWIVDMGPEAGSKGGEVLFSGKLSDFDKSTLTSRTKEALVKSFDQSDPKASEQFFRVANASKNNLKNVSAGFALNGLTMLYGPSGSGRSSLVDSLKEHFEQQKLEGIDVIVEVNQSPIGRTPRSNAATYIGIADHIRDVFAKLPASKVLGFKKSRYSFNNKGGRCETCQGAGKTVLGMHFMGTIEQGCPDCQGKRFNEATLEVKLNGKSIADVYKMSVGKSIQFFEAYPKILKGLKTLERLGLSYLKLGQSSNTLSGGEAQRIKIANELQHLNQSHKLFILHEPTIGLHASNIQQLKGLLSYLIEEGNSVVCIDSNEQLLQAANWTIELGPGSGKIGGEIVSEGLFSKEPVTIELIHSKEVFQHKSISFTGVETNNLKSIDLQIPKHQFVAFTGVSGSGKTSFLEGTMFAEANARFLQSLSMKGRSVMKNQNQAKFEDVNGLTPVVYLGRNKKSVNSRSTVGTKSGAYDLLRLLYSRIAIAQGKYYSMLDFSFNDAQGACVDCGGLGVQKKCSVDLVLKDLKASIFDGAFEKNKALDYYTDVDGQFFAILKVIGEENAWNLDVPWLDLTQEQRSLILEGTDEKIWEADWHFKTKTKEGVQCVKAPWKGILNYINEEYERSLHNKNIGHLESLMEDVQCETCQGHRLRPYLLEIKLSDYSISELCFLELEELYKLLSSIKIEDELIRKVLERLLPELLEKLQCAIEIGIAYLSLDRSCGSLSGGEYQRLALMKEYSQHLYGVTYVLDEPSKGLDQTNTDRLIQLLKELSKENTVCVIEHNQAVIQACDYQIEFGPGSGESGGEVIYAGSRDKKKVQLNQAEYHPFKNTQKDYFELKSCFVNNLQNIDVPLLHNGLNLVRGVSGSGKSSFVEHVLFPSVVRQRPIGCKSVVGVDRYHGVHMIRQMQANNIGRKTVAEFLGFDQLIAKEFAKQELAKTLKLSKNDFLLSKKGKCKSCSGSGFKKVHLDFYGDQELPCDVCNGSRFKVDLSEVNLKGRTIGAFYQDSVSALQNSFSIKEMNVIVQLAEQIGLAHLILNQSVQDVSFGERSRLLLLELLLRKPKDALIILDEPTNGLSDNDLEKLYHVFDCLLETENTLVVVDHHASMEHKANHILVLGPGAGKIGGQIVK